MPISDGVDVARTRTLPAVDVTVEPSITAVTPLLMRFQVIATPTPVSDLLMPRLPVTATMLVVTIDCTVASPPMVIVESWIDASMVLLTTLMPTEPAIAVSLSAPAPPMPIETIVPRLFASTETPPLVRSIELSTVAVTVLPMLFSAIATPKAELLPTANPPENE